MRESRGLRRGSKLWLSARQTNGGDKMTLAKILKILQIVLASGLIANVDTAKIKALIEIITLIMEDEPDGKVS